ncbi:MAG: hypothetical protein ACETVU_02650 [Desulfatiglandales bacterium]
MGTMYFFDMGQGGASRLEIWNSLPEDQHPKNQLSSMEGTFDGKQMGDGLAALAEKYGYKSHCGNLLAWGPRISPHRFSKPRQRAWMRFSYG